MTRRFKFAKLVRDKNLDSMLANPDQEPKFNILNDEAYLRELKLKLMEEVEELQDASDDKTTEEIADIYEILSYIVKTLGVSQETLDSVIQSKRDKVGGFNKKAYVEYVDVDEHSEWISKYQEQPHKYPELTVE